MTDGNYRKELGNGQGWAQRGDAMKNHELVTCALFALVATAGLLAGVVLALLR